MLKLRDRIALVYKETKYSYKQLLQHSYIYAEHFKSLNNQTQRVMIISENNPNYVFAIYGALRNGATTVPVDVTATLKDIKYIINDCRPEIIFTTEDKKELISEAVSMIEDYSTMVVTEKDIDLKEVEQAPIVEMQMQYGDDIVAIIYTSGTTGTPKGVMLSYKNFWYNIDAVANQVNIMNEGGRMMMILPLHHVFCYAGSLLAPIYAGMTIYIAESLAPDAIIRVLQEGRITVLIGVPRLYEGFAKGIMNKINQNLIAKLLYKLAGVIGSKSLSKKLFKTVHNKFGGCMEYFVCGGAALPLETASIFKNLGFSVLEGYGMTECAPMISFTRPNEIKVGYCGRLLEGLEMKIVENNEICVKGPNVMQGYYNRPDETAQVIKDGWLHTGDTGILHPKYGVQITGRIKEIIVTSSGKNINPAEIENELTALSNVIKEAAIILRDDALQAIIYPDMSAIRVNTGVSIEEAVKAEIEKYNIATTGYKRIKRYHVISQELPKTRLGKIKRHMLEALITEDNQISKKNREEELAGKSETFKVLKKFIDNETSKNASENDHFEIDLSLDSLGRVSFIAFIEDTFFIQIQENQLDELSTLNKLTWYIESQSSADGVAESSLSWKEIFELNDENLKQPSPGFTHWLLAHIVDCIMSVKYRVKTAGNKQYDTKTPTIFVGNHQSAFDGLFITSKMSWRSVRNTLFFAKQKHFDSKYKEFFANNYNVILMDINSNVRSSMQKMYQVLKSGKNIVIFPEGTRSSDGKLQEFKDGFAILAQSLNIPVVPVAISGDFAGRKKWKMFKKVNVDFLPAISPQEGESVKDFKQKVYDSINTALNRK